MSEVLDSEGWPERLPECIIEEPIADLLHEEIDYSANVLGNLWLERGSYAVIQGQSDIGKSMLTVQLGVEAALGREVFGFRVDKPLRVLILQAEDTKNDRVRQANCIKRLAENREEELLIKRNLRIVTPRKRPRRGRDLFDFLTESFADVSFDLLILNPAFAFLDGNVNDSVAVGDFLRSQLQEFLRAKNAAGLVVHHVPKTPKAKGRSIESALYAGHGSAEWANAPRASITISRTRVPWVFLFDIGKRGSYSGWERNGEGYYSCYFSHTRRGDMFWSPASPEDVIAAESGVSADDFASIFSGEEDFTFPNIKARFAAFGYKYSEAELTEVLEEAIERGRLIRVENEAGETVFRPIKSAKASAASARREANYALWIEETFLAIKKAGAGGINVNALRKSGLSFSNSVLEKTLEKLIAAGRIVKRADNRYTVAPEGTLTLLEKIG
jgi:hypothetical protein